MTDRPSPLRRHLAAAVDRVLDPTIALSFDRTGFRRHAVGFDPADLDVDLSGRVALVTGANSGIGKATARALARLGAQVWMLCRSAERGEAARRELAAETGGDLRLLIADVGDPTSLAAAVDALPVPAVHLLVHNAGALVDARHLAADGLESTLATHLVGPFRLTRALRPRLSDPAAPARIVWVSSGGMYTRRLSVDALQRLNQPGPFDGVTAYADVKRAQVVLSAQLASRWGLHSQAMHPGWASTPGVQRGLPVFYKVTRQLLRSPEEGADTVVWLCACPRLQGEDSGFWFDRRRVSPFLVPGTRHAHSEEERLWAAVEGWADRGAGVAG
jgi:NAD(P)-dependent dehydrogenase (short-subunit alcohol dehydrogenase family)